MKKSFAWWDVLIIGGALLILSWALLKSLGVIHSPAWVEMIPYMGAGASILGIAYKTGEVMNVIKIIRQDVNKLLSMEEKLNKLEFEHNLAMCGKLKMVH